MLMAEDKIPELRTDRAVQERFPRYSQTATGNEALQMASMIGVFELSTNSQRSSQQQAL